MRSKSGTLSGPKLVGIHPAKTWRKDRFVSYAISSPGPFRPESANSPIHDNSLATHHAFLTSNYKVETVTGFVMPTTPFDEALSHEGSSVRV